MYIKRVEAISLCFGDNAPFPQQQQKKKSSFDYRTKETESMSPLCVGGRTMEPRLLFSEEAAADSHNHRRHITAGARKRRCPQRYRPQSRHPLLGHVASVVVADSGTGLLYFPSSHVLGRCVHPASTSPFRCERVFSICPTHSNGLSHWFE